MNTCAPRAHEHAHKLLTVLLALALVLSSLACAGCGSKAADEQDNCYGEDMPVINE